MKGKANMKKCPKCRRYYHSYPALSRIDNRTYICPECRVREALSLFGLSAQEQEEILIDLRKETFKPGMRVRLLKIDDDHAPPVGTEGTVLGVDDIGSLLMSWDTGSSLNVVMGEDVVEII